MAWFPLFCGLLHMDRDLWRERCGSQEKGEARMKGNPSVTQYESEAVKWIRYCSVSDLNWAGALKRLSDKEIFYCIEWDGRVTAQKKLRAEAMRRGLGVELVRREASVHADWKLHNTRNSWTRESEGQSAFVAEAGGGKYFLTFKSRTSASRTIGRSFMSAGEAMRRGDELLDSGLRRNDGSDEGRNDGTDEVIDIEPEGKEMKQNQRPEVAAIDEAYSLGKKHATAEQASEMLESAVFASEAIGKVKAAEFNIKTNELLKYVTIYQVKQSKEYREGGQTWVDFCRSIGEPVRTVDLILGELSPLLTQISAKQAEILGMPLSKIRFLGRSVSANLAEISENAVVIGDQKIEIIPENKEDIEEAIDMMKEGREKERSDHEKEVARLKKRAENAASEETNSLTVERDALVKELARLKVFDPEGKDITWSVEQIKKIKEAALEFVRLCSKFILDDRLEGEIVLQAEVEKWQDVCRNALSDLRKSWNERFESNFGE